MPCALQSFLVPLLRDPEKLAGFTDPAEWDLLKAHASGRGVAQILAYHFRPYAPASARAWCDQVLLTSWRMHDKSLVELDSLLEIFERENIDVLALKGPMLARRHYAPPFLRKPSSDLDIGIRSADLARASQALERAGYNLELPLWQAQARSHSVEMRHPSRPHVDLHFRIANGPYGIPTEEFFSRARTETLPGGRAVLVLDPADEILQLLLHGGCGLATLFHSYEIRHIWSAALPEVRREAVRRAIVYHCAGVFAATNVLYGSLWGVPMLTADLPDVRTWLHRRIDDELLANYALAHERLATRETEPTFGFLLWKRWLDLQITDTPLDALRMVAIMGKSAVVKAIGELGIPVWISKKKFFGKAKASIYKEHIKLGFEP